MNFSLKNLTTTFLVSGVMTFGVASIQAQVTLKVDSTKTWQGYMNVSNLPENGGAYQFGSSWGTADLVAVFTGTSYLTLTPNTIGDPNAYWYTPSGGPGAVGNKIMEANMYVEVNGGSLSGQEVTFTGNVLSNTLVSGFTCVAFIKDFASDYSSFNLATAPMVDGSFSVVLNTDPGTGRHVQYGFQTVGPCVWSTDVGPKGHARIQVDNADPSITTQPFNARAVVGGSASFTVAAVGGSPLSYQWKRYGTNLVNAAGKFTGATSATLTVLNAQAPDDTTYSVVVSDSSPTPQTSSSVRLRVLAPADFANLLDNPSFELDVVSFGVVPEPWVNFTGSALLSGGDFIYTTAQDGTNVVQVYNAGQYNGIYQDVPAAPGQIFTGDCWLWQASLDALLAPVNEAFLEVQFWPVAGAPIAIYHSIPITNDLAMQDAWLHLEATNGVAAGYASTSTANAKYLVAPAGTHHVRFQITLHAEGGGSGSVFVDSMRLLQKVPVSVSALTGGGNITLSWASKLSSTYQVVYKDNLTDANWTPIGSAVTGDGTVKSAAFSMTGSKRFYSVLTQ